MYSQDVLKNRYQISLNLEALSGIKASSGYSNDRTDSALHRKFDDTVFIPGTSIKGVLRSMIEKTLASPNLIGLEKSTADNTLPCACTLFSDTPPDCNERLERHKSERIEKKQPEMTDSDLFDWANQQLCSVCRLFGASCWASRLTVHDLILGTGKPQVNHGVGIDRDTGAAKDQIKFDYEVFEAQPGSNFALSLVVENLTAEDKQILDILLVLMKQEVQFGGKTSSGFGRMKLNDECSVRGFFNASHYVDRLLEGVDPMETIAWREIVTC